MESFISLGRLHIPIAGIFAAAGLMCAMVLGLRTAALAGVDPDEFWNLSFVTVIAALVISRVVLVIENLSTFVRFPIAVLELPSITSSGLAVTAIFSLGYLLRRKLPVLEVLDAAAPCASIFYAPLSVGSWAGGIREGMPSTLPWAVGSSFGRVHPVEIYEAMAWLSICVVLVLFLRGRSNRGETAGIGLLLGGLEYALVPFFRLPRALYGNDLLDGQQWRGLELIVAGSLLLAWRFAAADRARVSSAKDLSRAF